MAKAKQLTVACENRPGTLAHVARVLSEAKVNILAFNCTTAGVEGAVHLIMDNVNTARNALDREKLSFTEEDVLCVGLPNVPGALARFAGKLAAKDINITAAYQTTVKGSKKASVILAVSDLDKAVRIR